jgi:hypothetical protein
VAIGTLECFISVKQSLYPILPRLQIRKRFHRIPKRRSINHSFLARFQPVNIDAKYLLRVEVFIDLKAWLAGPVL